MSELKCENRIAEEWANRKESMRTTTDADLLNGYALCFDYVEANTFGTHDGYHRYQMSWGGPQDEVRFYDDGQINYAFLDWYDHAEIPIEREAITKRLQQILLPFFER